MEVSLPRCSISGGNGTETTFEFMIPEANQLKMMADEMYPLVTQRGLTDFSCNIHSFGCSFWTTLSHRAGYSAVCEMPAPNAGPAGLTGLNVISDSAWFEPSENHPDVLVEFERYADEYDGVKLRIKVENLLLAYWRWEARPEHLVLAYWTRGLRNLPDHKILREIVRNGFVTAAREKVAGSRTVNLRFFQFLFDELPGGRWKLSRIIERGML
jgi:hypothetical protein